MDDGTGRVGAHPDPAALFEAMPCAVAHVDDAGTVTCANRAARGILGDTAVGREAADLLLPESARPVFRRAFRNSGELKFMTVECGTGPAFAATVSPHADGGRFVVIEASGTERPAGGAGALAELERDRAFLRDRFERERRDLIDADRRFAALFDDAAEPLLLAGRDLAVRRMNPAARDLLAPLLALRRRFELPDLFPADHRDPLFELARGGGGRPVRLEFPDGRTERVIVSIRALAEDERLVRLVVVPPEEADR